ncbi:MAG: helix-turn-helix domain-containing protein [Anaerolineales bacterium]|nr:helix-turn-helix domain-containing protein [Anaerolineales bacterium]
MIGQRIRQRRKELGLSLRELGARTRLSAGFLSQVENDKVAPSINSLQRIAAALDVPMFRFLDGAEQASPVIRAAERSAFWLRGWNTSYDLLTGPGLRAFMSVLIRVQPGSRVRAEQLIRPTEEWMLVLEGQLIIQLDAETHTLDPGDTISYRGASLRYFAAGGSAPVLVICCIAPPVL